MNQTESRSAVADADAARREVAEGRLRVIRNALSVADEELEQALVNRDWEVFGLPSFERYCAEMIPEFRHFKMLPEPRGKRIERLHRQGATIPQIVAATNSSLGTVHRRLVELEGGHKRQTAVAEPAPPLAHDIVEMCTAWQVVVRHVARAGATGLTSQEFEAQTGWNHGRASAAFHAAERKGYVVRLNGIYRSAYGVYVATDR